jgi:HSP20 family protein|tara:strand:- start:1616 stop:2092 length:477 start_codon:yes stop_codon:yes gene_type:complete
MTKVTFHRGLPVIDRESFLTPFDRMFDELVSSSFPQINETVGVNPFGNTAYPKVNVYEYEDKVGVIAEIPGLDKKDLNVEVEDGVLTIAGEKHNGMFDEAKAKILRRELKHSSFKRQFTLGDLLDGDNIKANFKDGILSVEIPKVEPELPKKNIVKIK